MQKIPAVSLAAILAFIAPAVVPANGQEARALVDALVRKGVLTDKEAEEVRAEMSRAQDDAAPGGKVKLSSSVTEMKLYGDVRLRYQWDNKDPQLDPFGVGVDFPREQRNPSGTQNSRWRFRLRLNADFKLGENFFGGVELQTASASDSANQTFEDGFSDYPIFISRAYVGWSPTDWLTVTGGKVPNPFYTTDLVWDADINPTGITEQIAFHKLWPGGNGQTSGYTKDGKAVVETAVERPWELTLVAGQFIFDDNPESAFDNDASTDAYLFQTQLVAAYKFDNGVKFTIAPGWLVGNAASVVAGFDINSNDFQDDDGLPGLSGAMRNLNILLLPGDISFKLGGLKTKVYWDLAYNIEGRKRAEDIYQLTAVATGSDDPDDLIKNHSNRDDYAFLVGVQFGENKKKGDWSLLANYRRIGIASVDPNLSDSDFALGELNTQGFKFGLAYNVADFAVFGVTYYHAWQLRHIIGGEATGGNSIADANDVQVLQVDLNVKF